LLIEEKGGPSLLKRISGDAGVCILSDPGQAIRKKIVEFVDTAKGFSAVKLVCAGFP